MNDNPLRCKLMTYNIGGGRRHNTDNREHVAQVIHAADPDVLALQEVSYIQTADSEPESHLDNIRDGLGPSYTSFYAPTLSLKEDLHTGKQAMVEAVFHDYEDWQQGNALIARWPFHRLGKRSLPGQPRIIPLFRPANYMGSRDTDPRNAVIGRIGRKPQYPLVIGLHLTTLVGERGGHILPGRPEEAVTMREEQVMRLLDLLRVHALERGEVVFLMGDFNAGVDERCIAQKLIAEAGFVHLTPINDMSTHGDLDAAIDHIFVYPAGRLLDYSCRIIDSGLAREASDHLPVVAEVLVQ